MEKFLEILKSKLGPKGYFEDPIVMAPYLADMRGRFFGDIPIITRPKTTEEVSQIIELCNEFDVTMIPQGGNTGLCAGATPINKNTRKVLINLSRMNKISPSKSGELYLEVEAGSTLKSVQMMADNMGLIFPLSLASEGSCQIGGNISTNAGGTHVLKYGTMRSLVLGLEVVLPNGQIWNGASSLLKNTAGYDLKQFFIGAEGTLGIVTSATLKLFPKPKGVATLLLGANDLQSLVNTYNILKLELGEDITAFEVFPDNALNFVIKHIPDTRKPFDKATTWYGLVEVWGNDTDDQILEKILLPIEKLINSNQILSAVAATTISQRAKFWKLRESLSEAQRIEGASIKNDISISPNLIGEFTEITSKEILGYMPDIRLTPFGHAGDGNLHFNLMQPKGMEQKEFLKHEQTLQNIVNIRVTEMRGSISAEHGIGRVKKEALIQHLDPIAYDLMRTIKNAIDPKSLMNPGVLF